MFSLISKRPFTCDDGANHPPYVAAAWSRPFRAMFTLPMRESQHKCRVVIKDVEQKHFMVALDYLYSGCACGVIIDALQSTLMRRSPILKRRTDTFLLSCTRGCLKRSRTDPSGIIGVAGSPLTVWLHRGHSLFAGHTV